MQEQIEDLQMRIAHQELAIEALTETVVRQERLLGELREEVQRIRREMRELRHSPLGTDAASEPPPPHY